MLFRKAVTIRTVMSRTHPMVTPENGKHSLKRRLQWNIDIQTVLFLSLLSLFVLRIVLDARYIIQLVLHASRNTMVTLC